MSTSLFMICEDCEEKSNSILTHSCFWKECCTYQDNFASFISKHFDKGCNFRKFKIIQEGDEDEKNYKFDHEKNDDKKVKDNKLFKSRLKNIKELQKEIGFIFADIPAKEQNEFCIIMDYDPLKDCYHLNITIRIYDGSLMPDYYSPHVLIPKPIIFQVSKQIIERLTNDINGDSVSGYLYELKDFIKETKEKFIEKLKFDIPYEDIKCQLDPSANLIFHTKT